MHLEFHYPRRSQVAPSVYLSDAILPFWFRCVFNYLKYVKVGLYASADAIPCSDGSFKKNGDFRSRFNHGGDLIFYLQVLAPPLPLQLPEQHSPELVHEAPLGGNRQTSESESWNCNWDSRNSHWTRVKLCESCIPAQISDEIPPQGGFLMAGGSSQQQCHSNPQRLNLQISQASPRPFYRSIPEPF